MKRTQLLIVGIFMLFSTDKALADCSGTGCGSSQVWVSYCRGSFE